MGVIIVKRGEETPASFTRSVFLTAADGKAWEMEAIQRLTNLGFDDGVIFIGDEKPDEEYGGWQTKALAISDSIVCCTLSDSAQSEFNTRSIVGTWAGIGKLCCGAEEGSWVDTAIAPHGITAVRSLDELLLSTAADDSRRRVDFGLQPQQGAGTKTGHHNHCVAPDGTQLLDGLGVLTRTTHALLRNDGVIVDCNGPMLHASTQRPDQTPSDITRKAHALQWLTVTPADHNHMLDEISSTQQQPDGSAAAASSAPTALQVTGNLGRHFRWGFDMRYSRSSNYQMFMVVCLSRWWYLMRLVEAHKRLLEGDAQLQGQFPGPNDTVAVFVTAETAETAATGGGSAVNDKDYVINTIRLLSMCKSGS